MISIRTKVIAIVLVVLAFIAIGVYFGFQKFYFAESPIDTAQETTISEQEKPALQEIKPPLGWKLYKNSEFGFEIQYPTSWTVTEEINENVRGEMVKEFYFKKPGSDLRFAILPRDGLSYGIGAKGTSTPVYIGGFSGMQTQYILKDGRRLWLIFPQYGLYNWLQDLGRMDVMTSVEDPIGDTQIFEKMLNSFKLSK